MLTSGILAITVLTQENPQPTQLLYSLIMLPLALFSALAGILGTRSRRQPQGVPEAQPPRFNWFTAFFPLAGVLCMLSGYLAIVFFIYQEAFQPAQLLYVLMTLLMALFSALAGILGTRCRRQRH